MNCCSKSGIQKCAPNSHIHVQIIHRIVMFSSADSPDDREHCFRMMNAGDTCRLCDNSLLFSFWTHLAVWFTGCMEFPRSCFISTWFSVTSSSLPVSCSERPTSPDSSFVATGFPVAVSTNPPRYAFCSFTWELDAASDFELLLILLSGFPVAASIPGLLYAIRLFADEELVGTWEDKFVVVEFDFATLPSSPFCSCILFATVLGQLIKLEFLAQQRELKRWTNEEDCSTHHVWNHLWSKCLRVDVSYQCIESEFQNQD